MERAYSFLPRIYPEIKCVIVFCYNNYYTFYNNSTMTSAPLAGENHTLTVTFSNGAHLSYTFQTVEIPTYVAIGAQASI